MIILIVGAIGWYAGFTSNIKVCKVYCVLIIIIVALQAAFAALGMCEQLFQTNNKLSRFSTFYTGFSTNSRHFKYRFQSSSKTNLQNFPNAEFLKKDDALEEVESYMNSTFNGTAYNDMSNSTQKVVDLIQETLECCGYVFSPFCKC